MPRMGYGLPMMSVSFPGALSLLRFDRTFGLISRVVQASLESLCCGICMALLVRSL